MARLSPRMGLGGISWLLRAAGFVLVVALTLSRGPQPHHHAVVAVLLIGLGLTLVTWATLDWLRAHRHPDLPPWAFSGVLGALAFIGGLASALGLADLPVVYAGVASVSAGTDLPLGLATAVVSLGALGIETSGLVFGFSAGSSLGLPLLLIACLVFGLYRRQAQQRAETAGRLVNKLRHAQEGQRRAAALEERNRIAREIHDVLAHSLSALGIQIEAARAVLGEAGDIERTLQLLERAQHLVDDGLTDSRRAIHALRNDTPPLPEALTSIAQNYNVRRPDQIGLVISGQPRPVSPAANVALFRVANEALVNAGKYAPATPVRIALNYEQDQTTLTISNTAPPLALVDPPSAPDISGGYGLAGMRERLLLLGGTLTAGPLDGGWTVIARIPE